MRHALRRIGGVQAGDVHQVGNHGAGGGLGTRAFAVVQRGAHGIAVHHHGVHRTFHIGDQALGRNQGGVHAQLDALGCALGDAQQLDAVTQLLRVLDVGRAELGDAFDIGLVKLHRNAKRNGAHQCELVRGVHAFNVKGRVGFGVTQALRIFQHHVKVQALVAHLAQDEVGGAVDDAGDPLDAVGGQAFAQRLDDGDATGHGRFKRHHHALGGRCGKDLGAVHGQQRLVGGDHMLARGNGFQHQLLGQRVATNQLDHDVDVGVADDLAGIGHHLGLVAHDLLRQRGVAARHHGDLNATASTAFDFFLVALQHVENTAAHGAQAHHAYLYRFHKFFR